MARETPGRFKNIRQPCSGKLRGMAGIVSGPHVQSGPGSILTINSNYKSKAMNKNMTTIAELKAHYVNFGGFAGGWNVILEVFGREGNVAVSRAMPALSWIVEELKGVSDTVEISPGLVVLVIPWQKLTTSVVTDALRNRLLVDISGCLSCENWAKAMAFSCRKDGRIRRSIAKVPVGLPYWCPTPEQLESIPAPMPGWKSIDV